MRVVVAIVCVLGACGFDVGVGGTQIDGSTDDGGSGDARDPIDAPLGPPVACDTPTTNGLVACFELEDGVTDGTLRDSSPLLRDATTTGLVAIDRTKPATSAAATVTTNVSTYVPDTGAFDLASGYSVTMWIKPTDVPSSSRVYGLFDHEEQFAGAIARAANGNVAHLRCINTGKQYEYTDSIPIDEWSFIACTWDGVNLCAQYWSADDDHQRFCAVPTGIAPDGSHGLAIGHLSNMGQPEQPFVGSVDSVHVYNRHLTPTELCAQIGKPPDCFQ